MQQIEEIIQEFEQGLKKEGDAFVKGFLDQYKEHPEFETILKESIQAYSRYKGINPEKGLKFILDRAEKKLLKQLQEKMDEIHTLLENQKWEEALSIVDSLLEKADLIGLQPNQGLYSIPNFVQETLFSHYIQPENYEIVFYPMDELYNTKAFILLNEKKFVESKTNFEKALQWNPVHFRALNGEMITSLQVGEEETYANCLKKMHQSVTDRTEQSIYCEKLAVSFLQKNQVKEAVVSYNVGLAWNPNYQGNILGLQNLEKEGVQPFSQEEMNATLVQNQVLLQPCQETIDVLKSQARYYEEKKNKDGAKEIYATLVAWLQDEEAKKKLDKKKKKQQKKSVKKQKKSQKKQHKKK